MKIRFWQIIFLCGLLLFQAGCGSREEAESREDAGQSSGQEESKEQDDGKEAVLSLRLMEPLQSEDPDHENLADMLQRAGSGMMVQLRAGGLLGSGVICGAKENQLLILTAAHVLEEAGDAVEVVFTENASVFTEEFECFMAGDFALVRVSGGDVSENTLERCLCANIDKNSFDEATRGQGCIVMGSRSGVAAEAYEGVILDHWIYMEDYGQYMMWVKAEGKPGMSGGGLFDRQGHLLGIISGGSEDGELAVVPLSLILAEVELP